MPDSIASCVWYCTYVLFTVCYVCVYIVHYVVCVSGTTSYIYCPLVVF